MKTSILFALLALCVACSLSCRSVSYCDGIGTHCASYGGFASVVEEEEEEVVLTFSTTDENIEEQTSLLATTLSNETKELQKKFANKFVDGNIILPDGRCATACQWFGINSTTAADQNSQICAECSKRFIVYTPKNPFKCFSFPASINKGEISADDINKIKQGCIDIANCKCKEGNIQTDKVVILLQALNSEFQGILQELGKITDRIKADVGETTKNLQNELEFHNTTCLTNVEAALKNVTISYDKSVVDLTNYKNSLEKEILKAKNRLSTTLYTSHMNKILGLRARFLGLFQNNLLKVTTWLVKCQVEFKKAQFKKEVEKKKKETHAKMDTAKQEIAQLKQEQDEIKRQLDEIDQNRRKKLTANLKDQLKLRSELRKKQQEKLKKMNELTSELNSAVKKENEKLQKELDKAIAEISVKYSKLF